MPTSSKKSSQSTNVWTRWIGLVLLLIGSLFLLGVFFRSTQPKPKRAVDLRSLHLETAATNEARIKGLSERSLLASDQGMLFVFPTSGIYPFWMKDMRFPLDIIWINGTTVVEVVTLAAPRPDDLLPPRHTPLHKADHVLELNAGEAKRLGIEPGVQVILSEGTVALIVGDGLFRDLEKKFIHKQLHRSL